MQEFQEKPESGELETPDIGSEEKRTGKAKRENKRKNKNAQAPPQVYTYTIVITEKPCWGLPLVFTEKSEKGQ